MDALKTRLMDGARAMGLEMDAARAEQFAQYHAMLVQANARTNLTRVPDDALEAADRNYLDCLAPLCDLPEGVRRAVDVGSGAGFPGIPMAIMRPDIHFVLLDSLGKRAAFLQSVIDALGLNAKALHLRAEDAARDAALRERFDLAVARAVAPMNVLCEYLLPFVAVGGHMLALKGPSLQEELDAAQGALDALGGALARVTPANVPGRDWDHRAAWIAKTAPTPEKYPRKAGLPEKRPL